MTCGFVPVSEKPTTPDIHNLKVVRKLPDAGKEQRPDVVCVGLSRAEKGVRSLKNGFSERRGTSRLSSHYPRLSDAGHPQSGCPGWKTKVSKLGLT